MNKRSLLLLSLLIGLFFTSINGSMNNRYKGERPTSEPFVSGDTFRKYCDHVLDIKNPNLDPSKVKKGDIIFLSTFDYNEKPSSKFIVNFFEKHAPLIKNKYILCTHNSTAVIKESFKKYCDSENLFAWFAHNVEYKHPKLIPIPLGLENELWGRKYTDQINYLRKNISDISKEYLLYMNFSIHTNPSSRKPIYDLFASKDFCHVTSRMNLDKYLVDICKAKFVVSPPGSAPDCHRVWESLYLGVIPVIKESLLNSIYEDLPVLIVDNWNTVTEEFLEKKYIEMSHKSYNTEKLFIDYWIGVFKKYKDMCINSTD